MHPHHHGRKKKMKSSVPQFGSGSSVGFTVCVFGVLLTALSLGGCSSGDPEPLESNGRPVVLISIDSLRADHCTPYGYKAEFTDEATTPFMAELGAEGAVFENAQSVTSWTLPSHISLVTGMNTFEHGVRNRLFRLKSGTEHIAGRLKRAGYHTGGVYTAPFLHPQWGYGEKFGFDFYKASTPYLEDLNATAIIKDVQAQGRLMQLHNMAHIDKETSGRAINYAIDWLKKDEKYKEPFFLFLHLWDPHYDYDPPQRLRDMFNPGYTGKVTGKNFIDPKTVYTPEDLPALKALYDAEIRYTDEQIERLFRQLEAWGLADKVIFAITSDHGEEFFEHGKKGHQKTLYEEVTHIPMVVRATGALEPGTRVAGTVALYDLAPTLLDLAGVALWEDRSGRSMMPLIAGTVSSYDVLMDLEMHTRNGAHLRGWRDGPEKRIWDMRRANGRKPPWLSFNLSEDPKEIRQKWLESLPDSPSNQQMSQKFEREKAFEPYKIPTPFSWPMQMTPEMQSALSGVGYAGDDEEE